MVIAQNAARRAIEQPVMAPHQHLERPRITPDDALYELDVGYGVGCSGRHRLCHGHPPELTPLDEATVNGVPGSGDQWGRDVRPPIISQAATAPPSARPAETSITAR